MTDTRIPRSRWTNLVPAQVREGVRALAPTTGAGEILIYDVIDSWGDCWGVSAQDVAAALAELGNVQAITVRLNSPGGDYFEGVAIAGMLARHPATVTICVDGLAASAASVVAMGGDRIVMGAGSQLMIHEASSIAWGTAGDMRRTAAMLDQTNDDVAAMYAQRAGGDVATWRAAVAEETWYTAAQAVAAGLADEVAQLPARVPAEPVAARLAPGPVEQPAEPTPTPDAGAPPVEDAAPAAALPTAALPAPPAPPLPAAPFDPELLRSAIREATR
jgi:ATP-dependent protease ClpP protease subunit